MEAVAIARFLKCVFIWDSCNNSLHRHNWLDNDHIIGRLLKPHMENTIFVNFRARDTLMAETDSYMENYMSVCPCLLLILASLIFLNSILRWGRLEQRSWWLRRWLEGTVQHIAQLRWSKQKSKRASQCWALNQVQLVGRSLPEEDGGERVPSKQVRWVERVPLQVKSDERYKLNHNSSIEKMAFVCGTPCTGMWRGLSTLCIHVIR